MENALCIAKLKAGGNTGLAKALGNISPQAIGQWRRVPAERVLNVEAVTGISRHELRPDIYGPSETEQAV
ncbi:transcriptional regulator [Pararhizobium mangrovi]|uniref:Helix-turn-helix domain-containing protein n=1 Tax=Pararhizobium mangrovi TaxID=2590452 RepID=A0A506U2A8_9HYPH|nr:YdaS family helix-turn-helix protein [Pararhizobium mangrovi]TPW26007.1 helix-turn-helix domain-containing protein [Pararhizobium mangrovi]